MKLWSKGTDAADWVTRFTVGDDYLWDTMLLPYDIEGTRAHAWALSRIDLLTDEDLRKIERCLDQMNEEVGRGEIVVQVEDEDAHTVIENYLTRHLGDLGKKIHAGRSRNDQVLVALRMFLREELRNIGRRVMRIIDDLCALGERYDSLMMPGYTHMQRAMPSSAGLWAMGYAELLCADLETLRSAHGIINVSPWGSAAGYGVPYLQLPRREVAERLGFEGVQTHVTAVQLSRGKFELSTVHSLVQIGATFNRMSSDLVLYSTSEFRFVKIPPAFCTGSSIMPQKQNPDVLELSRAVYHRLLAEMLLLQTLPANLTSGYHRDLQLTKEAVMRAALLTRDLVTGMHELVPALEFNEEELRHASSSELFATHRALELVNSGIPFREAYRQAASEVSALRALSSDKALASYSVEGYPGRVNAGLIRARCAEHASWLGDEV